jgi:phosphorylcholine metabolism protein LicD
MTEFNKTNIPIWLDFGTLLGYYRENDIICYDMDVDLSGFYSDKIQINNILKEVQRNNKDIYVHNKCIIPAIVCMYAVIHKPTGNYVDILLYTKNKNNYVGGFPIKKYKYVINKDIIEPLQKVKFLDREVYIPNKTEVLLKHLYGENYMKPILLCDNDCNICKPNTAINNSSKK